MKTQSSDLHVTLTPAPEAAEGLTLRATAAKLVVIDTASHEVCRRFQVDLKALKRKIEAHYAAIKAPLNAARATVLEMERQHLAPIDEALKIALHLDVSFIDAEERRVAAEAARQREENERIAREQREAELAAAEAEAAQLEADSPNLSAREQTFVDGILAGFLSNVAAERAGYKNPEQAAARLGKTQKVLDAIAAAQQARAIREQAEAQKAAPLVVEAPVVKSRVAKVAGTSVRTTYSAQCIDVLALAKAVVEGRVPVEAIQADSVFLNRQAVALRETFERVYPGCKLVKNTGIAG